MLDSGVKANLFDVRGTRPMAKAARQGHSSTVKLLLDMEQMSDIKLRAAMRSPVLQRSDILSCSIFYILLETMSVTTIESLRL